MLISVYFLFKKMSAGNNSEDDLTTDAVPSPPRDEIKEQRTENATQNVPPRTKTKVFKKPKKVGPSGKTPKSEFEFNLAILVSASNVINIKNSQGIHVGSDYKIYINSNKAETPKQKDFVVTDTINELFTSERLVERKDLIFISLHINEHWRTMARALDFSDGRISHFYEDYIKSGIKEVLFLILQKRS